MHACICICSKSVCMYVLKIALALYLNNRNSYVFGMKFGISIVARGFSRSASQPRLPFLLLLDCCFCCSFSCCHYKPLSCCCFFVVAFIVIIAATTYKPIHTYPFIRVPHRGIKTLSWTVLPTLQVIKKLSCSLKKARKGQ